MENKTRKRLSLFRLVVLVAGFGFIMHLTHRECAKVAYDAPQRAMPVEKTIKAVEEKPINVHARIKAGEVFHATAYCVTGTTRSGFLAAPGLVSADPKVIPLGSIIHVESPLMGGIYQVLDTGDLVKGKIIDIFIPSYEKCMEFGRRMVKVKVLRYGFHDKKPEKAEKPDQPAK
jgi:3D (Asp-Asp-Asp) domain-containing protein